MCWPSYQFLAEQFFFELGEAARQKETGKTMKTVEKEERATRDRHIPTHKKRKIDRQRDTEVYTKASEVQFLCVYVCVCVLKFLLSLPSPR